eukprot:2557558-Rhodomonas_salina.1
MVEGGRGAGKRDCLSSRVRSLSAWLPCLSRLRGDESVESRAAGQRRRGRGRGRGTAMREGEGEGEGE